MINFLNDYDEICHTKILENLSKFNGEKYPGYSTDVHTKNAIDYLKRDLKNDGLDIHFVHGGTIVNVLGLLISLNRYEGIVSCDTGHIVNTENGSIEAVGQQIIQVPNIDGKITVENIQKAIENHSEEYCVEIKVVYISNATEKGTIYSKAEIETLSKFCKQNNLYLFMDGARIGTAMACEESDLKMEDLSKYFDVFSIGGTKNGMLFGEALIIVNDDLKKGIRKIIKQRGALLAKGFLYGIQFETMFEDGLYYENAKKAVNSANRIANIFLENGFELASKQQSNLVFPIVSDEFYNMLSKEVIFEHHLREGEKNILRFATTWNTSSKDIDELEIIIKKLLKQR